ncbi:MAG: hypothetical protein Q9M31_00435, partial [Mariprofundus sp.]|nr:hypothetical protein [Mariprofundus sp.]
TTEPLAKPMSGDLLPHSGAFPGCVQRMEPPCPSFHPEHALEVGLSLIHPEFCKWLYCEL